MIRLGLALVLIWQTTPQTPTPVDAIARAEAKWQATKPAVYEFTLELTSLIIERPSPAFRVTNGTPERVKPIDPKKAADYSSFDTIDELFAILKLYASRAAVKLDVQYDAEFGFPVSADLDRSRDVFDDELAFKVIGFRVVTK